MSPAALPALLASGAAAFAATNVDDLFVLLALFGAAGGYRGRQIVAGQVAGIGALTAAGALGGAAVLRAAPSWAGWLGLLPVALGVKAWREAGRADEDEAPAPARTLAGGALAVAAVTVANGGDNLGVYVPLFAAQGGGAAPWLLAAEFLLLAVLWCVLARGLARHPAVAAALRRAGPRLLPAVLIALGAWIVLKGVL